MTKTKSFLGKITVKLTGIKSTPTIPVICGIASVTLKDTVIDITKINKDQVKMTILVNITNLNNGYKTYITTGNIISKNKIQFSANFVLDNYDFPLILSDAIITFSDKKHFEIECVGYAGPGQASGVGSFKAKKCQVNSTCKF